MILILSEVRQLQRLGYTPLVIPYSGLTSPENCQKALVEILQLNKVRLPNLDDGWLEANKKY
jgi:hypothetical protein